MLNPSIEEEKASWSFSNLIKPLVYTPAAKFNVITIVNMEYHELYTVYLPYSLSVIILVKIGVEIKATPFCKNPQIINHNEAFTGSLKSEYFFIADFINTLIVYSPFIVSQVLNKYLNRFVALLLTEASYNHRINELNIRVFFQECSTLVPQIQLIPVCVITLRHTLLPVGIMACHRTAIFSIIICIFCDFIFKLFVKLINTYPEN